MGHRLSKIYTKTGDDGTTGLGDGSRTTKNSARVEAFGTVDELNSTVGVILAHLDASNTPIHTCLLDIQHDLFDLGGELCIPGTVLIEAAYTQRLESTLDQLNATLKPLKNFILPGGGAAAAYCHLARTVARRCERRLISLHETEQVNEEAVRYINRLSDLLFVIARKLACDSKSGEQLWDQNRHRGG